MWEFRYLSEPCDKRRVMDDYGRTEHFEMAMKLSEMIVPSLDGPSMLTVDDFNRVPLKQVIWVPSKQGYVSFNNSTLLNNIPTGKLAFFLGN